MKIIAHRGNLNGPNQLTENTPVAIDACIKLGYDVEIDIWNIDNIWWLGHDQPDRQITESWLLQRVGYLWIHAKNIVAVHKLCKTPLHWFWHENDSMTLTSRQYIWCFPGIFVNNGITVVLNKNVIIPQGIGGICTDYPDEYTN